MGFGLPAAIGAKIGAPEREVCLFVGDGGLQMTSQELGTIYQSEVGVKIILMNNGYLGMVRQWQELFYNRRYSFTELVNPDFELLAKANRIPYRCVERHEDLDDAIEEMRILSLNQVKRTNGTLDADDVLREREEWQD